MNGGRLSIVPSMSTSTARGLAGAGAILVVFSLITPWFVLQAQGLTGDGKAGITVLGPLTLVLVALAILAGWSGAQRLHPAIPLAASSALVLLVLGRLLWPPSAAGAFGDFASGDPLASAFVSAFAQGITKDIGLHYAPAWGIWLALIGCLAAVAGTAMALVTSRERRPLSATQPSSEGQSHGF